MTKQEYFDLLCKCAVDGTFPSYSVARGICMYKNGFERCAVGILIQDEDYQPDLEGGMLNDLPIDLVRKILPKGLQYNDLQTIQTIHDNMAVRSWDSDLFIRQISALPVFADCLDQPRPGG